MCRVTPIRLASETIVVVVIVVVVVIILVVVVVVVVLIIHCVFKNQTNFYISGSILILFTSPIPYFLLKCKLIIEY